VRVESVSQRSLRRFSRRLQMRMYQWILRPTLRIRLRRMQLESLQKWWNLPKSTEWVHVLLQPRLRRIDVRREYQRLSFDRLYSRHLRRWRCLLQMFMRQRIWWNLLRNGHKRMRGQSMPKSRQMQGFDRQIRVRLSSRYLGPELWYQQQRVRLEPV
jgi:hypothetical protein